MIGWNPCHPPQEMVKNRTLDSSWEDSGCFKRKEVNNIRQSQDERRTQATMSGALSSGVLTNAYCSDPDSDSGKRPELITVSLLGSASWCSQKNCS